MGGLLHLFDFHQGHVGRRLKKRGGVARRQSLEVPADDWRRNHGVTDCEKDTPYGSLSPTDAAMKKLIKEEISKLSNNKQKTPSIVAKLMGVDAIPVDKKHENMRLEDDSDQKGFVDKKVQHVEKVSAVHVPKKTKSSSKKQRSYKDSYFRYWGSGTNLGKTGPRVHPQEKELQKFKKEFESWQAARFLECARAVELGNIPDQWLAQLNLTKEKMALYESSRNDIIGNPKEVKNDLLKSRSLNGGEFQDFRYIKERFPADPKDSYPGSSRGSSREFDRVSPKDSDLNSYNCSSPSKIVILKPGPDSFTTNEESWFGSNCSVEDRDCIEDLLEEVKQRLKFEMQGKVLTKGSMVRGGGIETPYKEKPAYTKKVHQSVAEQLGGNVNKKPARRLLRSESARSYQTDFHLSELAPSSPEIMSLDTRTFLSERLKNVLKGESQQNFDDVPGSPLFDDARDRLEKARDILIAEAGQTSWREPDARGKSFRHERDDDGCLQEQPTPSPRKLSRSLSAPVSGTSFGKLLLEDRNLATGAHIKRKHEALGNLSVDGKGHRKDIFNLRDKVSTFRSSLSLRKMLFSKKLQSAELSQSNECDSPKDLMSGPTILGFNDRIDNSTEVPPSPASVCSTPREEFWRPIDNPSSMSASDVTSVGDQSVGNAFREISSNLTELRKQLDQLEYEGSEITTITEEPLESEVVDLEDEAEMYIKELLVTSGLYDGSWDKSFSRWDPYVKPVSNWVLEKVEESYRKPIDDDEEVSDDCDDSSLERKMLFDLLNEALTVVLGPPRILSKFRRKTTDTNMLPLPQGRRLLEQVWEMICEYLNPSTEVSCYTLDDLVAHDLDIMPWSNLIDEEITALGKELEYQITGELVEELLLDMQL